MLCTPLQDDSKVILVVVQLFLLVLGLAMVHTACQDENVQHLSAVLHFKLSHGNLLAYEAAVLH